jgi:hypothetical protein
MPERRPPPSVELKDFPGLVTKADPDDEAPGAARVQTNVTSQTPGQLRVRGGLRQVLFEE